MNGRDGSAGGVSSRGLAYRFWPTPAVPSSSRKPPMEKMAVRRRSAMREISPTGSFSSSWLAGLNTLQTKTGELRRCPGYFKADVQIPGLCHQVVLTVGRKHAMKSTQIDARLEYQNRQPSNKVEGLEDNVRRAVPVRRPELGRSRASMRPASI